MNLVRLVAFTIFATSLFAQSPNANPNAFSNAPQTPAIPDNASARALLQACSSAMGANARLASLHLQGTRASQGRAPSPVEVDIAGITAFREQWITDGVTNVTIVADQRRKTLRNDRPQSADETAEPYFLPDVFPPAMCAIQEFAPNVKPDLLENEAINGRPTFHVRFVVERRFKDAKLNRLHAILSERHLWIDRETLLVLKAARRVFSSDTINNSSLWEVAYSDYRQVGRYLVPFVAQMSLDGRVVELYTITDATVAAEIQEEGR